MLNTEIAHLQKEIRMNTSAMHFSYIGRFLEWCSTFEVAHKKTKEKNMDKDRIDIPEKELLEYIHDAIPQLKGKDIPKPNTWHCDTPTLPLPLFKHGAMIVWNDEFIAPEHGARKHCGEGPFTVYIMDDFLVAFTKGDKGVTDIRVPKINRITIESPDGNIIIAHPGFFKLHKEHA